MLQAYVDFQNRQQTVFIFYYKYTIGLESFKSHYGRRGSMQRKLFKQCVMRSAYHEHGNVNVTLELIVKRGREPDKFGGDIVVLGC